MRPYSYFSTAICALSFGPMGRGNLPVSHYIAGIKAALAAWPSFNDAFWMEESSSPWRSIPTGAGSAS